MIKLPVVGLPLRAILLLCRIHTYHFLIYYLFPHWLYWLYKQWCTSRFNGSSSSWPARICMGWVWLMFDLTYCQLSGPQLCRVLCVRGLSQYWFWCTWVLSVVLVFWLSCCEMLAMASSFYVSRLDERISMLRVWKWTSESCCWQRGHSLIKSPNTMSADRSHMLIRFLCLCSRTSSDMAADDKSSSSSSTEWSAEPPVISPTSPSHLTHFKPLTPEQDEPPLRSAYSSFVNLFRFNSKGQGSKPHRHADEVMLLHQVH